MNWAGTPGHRILTLKKTLRVDVNVEADLALAPGRGGEPFPQIGGEIEATRGFHQQPEAMAAAHDGERCFRWSQHAHVLRRRRDSGEPARKEFGRRPLARRDEEAREPPERRIMRLFAQLDLARVERVAVG